MNDESDKSFELNESINSKFSIESHKNIGLKNEILNEKLIDPSVSPKLNSSQETKLEQINYSPICLEEGKKILILNKNSQEDAPKSKDLKNANIAKPSHIPENPSEHTEFNN